LKTTDIFIKGRVQGVGFRPFVCRIAEKFKLNGWVNNRSDGVHIRVNIEESKLAALLGSLRKEAPPASEIISIEHKIVNLEEFQNFSIVKSADEGEEVTQVSPDIACCNDCKHDMQHQQHRINYPFINCTNCGPRFTIIRDIPYDRAKTTMDVFPMCDICKKEYEDILDRRFHAQPVACNSCGPQLSVLYPDSDINGTDKVISFLAEAINSDKIVAIKGMGGYFLACNAESEIAVSTLRRKKKREGKPFALMFRDKKAAEEYCHINADEKKLLESWQRPIVLLAVKKMLPAPVLNGMHTIGAMLPYMPFHYLMFEKLQTSVLVMTSGNISDEPIVISDSQAVSTLITIADCIVSYNRAIHNRVDDSVLFQTPQTSHSIRRSRGYAPSPVQLSLPSEGLFAAGAELTNCFCIGKGNQAIMSQHIGDLQNAETYAFYTESVERYARLFKFNPSFLVADLHPDYLSTRFVQNYGLPYMQVQHHHAHIAASCAVLGLNEKVIGIAFDGTGLGDDGHIWGGEVLVADMIAYERLFHFEYIPLPGGEIVSKEPWRTALAWLWKTNSKSALDEACKKFPGISADKLSLVLQTLDKQINTPFSSSAGRLFDAVAALCGLCTEASFHAQAPMLLEAIANKNEHGFYSFRLENGIIKTSDIIQSILKDIERQTSISVISARFHASLANIALSACAGIKAERGINKVVLSGGVFQNRLLYTKTSDLLEKHGFDVLHQGVVPLNDGGIALGQLCIAAAHRNAR